MDGMLKMNKLSFFEKVMDTSAMEEDTMELIVPDMMPDILRVVESSGLACLKEKELSDGRLSVSGVVRVVILYVPETDNGINKLEVTVPFSHDFMDAQIMESGAATAMTDMVRVDVRIINPRKIMVSSSVRICAKAYNPAEQEFGSNIENMEELGIQVMRRQNNLLMPSCVKDKYFTIVDELEIPNTKPVVTDILRTDVSLIVQDSKIIGNKLVIKGTALIKTIYQSGLSGSAADCVFSVEHALPFSQILEADHINEDSICDVELFLGGMEMYISGSANESRSLSVTMNVGVQMTAYTQQSLSMITDLYSTDYSLSVESRSFEASALMDQGVKRQNVREVIEAGVTANSILDISVKPEKVTGKREEEKVLLVADTMVSVVYIGEDGALYCVMRQIPVSIFMDYSNETELISTAKFTGEAFATATSGGIEIRFSLDFAYIATSHARLLGIKSVKVDTSQPKDMSGQPSIIICRPNSGESLWDMAKRYNTTMKDIQMANGMETSEELISSRLLIPKKR